MCIRDRGRWGQHPSPPSNAPLTSRPSVKPKQPNNFSNMSEKNTSPAPAKNTAVFTPGNTPGTTPAVPGAGQPSTPGGTPWVPNGTPTGVEAPGFFAIFFDPVSYTHLR